MTTDQDASQKQSTESSPTGSITSIPPPPIALYQLATGHYVSRALCLAAKLDIGDLLKDGPRHYRELADVTGTHAPSLQRVMRLLASVGVFREEADGNFALTPVGECLRTGVPGSSRAMVMLFAGPRLQDSWKDLEYCVRTGQPAFRLRGLTNTFEDPQRTPEEEAIFDAAMADLTRLIAVAVTSVYNFTPFRFLIDVSGGNGALMIGVLKAHPSLRGMVLDQPAAIDRAKKQIEDNGLAERCQAVAQDFFQEVPQGGDAYTLKHVIHDWDDENAVRILKNCRRAISEHGKLLIRRRLE